MSCSPSDFSSLILLYYINREDKYAHTCVVPLQNGCSTSDGTKKVKKVIVLLLLFRDYIYIYI
jgi:thimet oligopeptidase